MAPSRDLHLGHIIAVLRRSPTPVASSSPSPCRRADGTLPRPQLDQEYEGRHRAGRVLNSDVPYVRCLDRSDREDVRLHQPRCANASSFVYEGTWTHSPLSLLCITMILCVRKKILKLLRSPTHIRGLAQLVVAQFILSLLGA